MLNRTQALVLGFFLLAVISLLVILAAAPEVYDQALRLPTGNRAVEIAVLAALIGFVTLRASGLFGDGAGPSGWSWSRSWPGCCGVPVAVLQLAGVLEADGPRWYVTFQGLLGVLQFAIGLAMVAGYRRAGIWG